MPTLDDVLAEINKTATAWNGWQKSFEQKAQDQDRLITSLRGELIAMKDRADNLEAVLSRPGGGRMETKETVEVKAWRGLLRAGPDRLEPHEAKALMVGRDPEGGYFAPAVVSNELIRLLIPVSPIRQIARIMQIGGPEVTLPRQTGTPAGTWLGEVSQTPESTPTFGQARIPVHRVSAYVEASTQLLEDAAINIEDELNQEFALEFGRAEGQAFALGNGVQRPRGFLTFPPGSGAGQIRQIPSGAAINITPDSMIDAFYALAQPYRANSSWVMNSSTLAQARKLKDGNGRYLWDAGNGGIVSGQPETILGRPVFELGDMPDPVAGALPVALADWREAYRIVDRVNMTLVRDPYTKARNGIVCFHATRRVGGEVVRHEAIVLVKVATS